MSAKLLLRGGRVVDPSSQVDAVRAYQQGVVEVAERNLAMARAALAIEYIDSGLNTGAVIMFQGGEIHGMFIAKGAVETALE